MTSGLHFVADESCDFAVVRSLRGAGYRVWAVAEEAPRTPDPEVLARAQQAGAVVITEEKDFGRLVFAEGQGARGVLLLRYPASDRLAIAAEVVELVARLDGELQRSFVTLTERGVRIRPLPEG